MASTELILTYSFFTFSPLNFGLLRFPFSFGRLVDRHLHRSLLLITDHFEDLCSPSRLLDF